MASANTAPAVSVDRAMETVRILHRLGQRAAGTGIERRAAELLADRMRAAGFDRVSLEEFRVEARHYGRAELAVLAPEQREIAAAHGALSPSTGPEPIIAPLIDARWGTAADFDRLAARGIDVRGAIVLIDRRDDLTMWADVPARQAAARGAATCVLSMRVLERDALRIDGVAGAPIPVLFIRYNDSQHLRELCRRGPVTASFLQEVQVDAAGVSQNVVGEIIGSELPDEWIVLGGHYDSWFGGAIDNANGTAAAIEAGRVLREAGTRHSVRVIAFGAEESGTSHYFYWCRGSQAYVRAHIEEMPRVLLNINADAFAFGPTIFLEPDPGIAKPARDLLERLAIADRFKSGTLPSIGTDQWAFTEAGVPSITLGPDMDPYWKLYQTEFDGPEIVDVALFEDGLRFIVELALAFDRGDPPPYDIRGMAHAADEALANSRRLKHLVQARALRQRLAEVARLDGLDTARARALMGTLTRFLVTARFDNHYQAEHLVQGLEGFLEPLIRLAGALRGAAPDELRAAALGLPTMAWGQHADRQVYAAVVEGMKGRSLLHFSGVEPWDALHLDPADPAAIARLLQWAREERAHFVRVAGIRFGVLGLMLADAMPGSPERQ